MFGGACVARSPKGVRHSYERTHQANTRDATTVQIPSHLEDPPMNRTLREKRQTYRIDSAGLAVCWSGDKGSCYAIANMSLGGALICGGAMWPLGQNVLFVMKPGELESLEFNASVVRADPKRSLIGLRFSHTDPETEERLEDLVTDRFMSSSEG
ncbi:MAG: hypothetical protein CO108_16445 [Deltaproteobacteria bacterium CG_4_9_14_3_um_filter_63_12]|nr:MAG: hypothetical protein CO108_16445 [Deltaproteobacteria bacterium CG_4_9_14_3_um_filter_63_12]